MATGTKTFAVAALMAIVALCGSMGASNAAGIQDTTLHPSETVRD